MRELRQLDLQLALGAARAQREDVEDEARPVDDAARELLLEVALLHARQRVVEDHEVGLGRAALRVDLVDLAAAREEGGVGPRAAAGHGPDDVRARGDRQRRQLAQTVVAVAVAEIKRDQECAAAAARAFEHQGNPAVMAVRTQAQPDAPARAGSRAAARPARGAGAEDQVSAS